MAAKETERSGPSRGLSRDERLKQALRANLRRRKAQQRARGKQVAGQPGAAPSGETGRES